MNNLESTQKVAVIGGGSWATAIVKILTNNLSCVYWWVREPEIKEGVETHGLNPLYLSSARLNTKRIRISNSLEEVIANVDTLVLVVPSAYVHTTLQHLSSNALNNKNIVSAIKGIVPETMETISSYIENHFHVSEDRMCVVCGPSHAEEIASERLTYLTAGSQNMDLATYVAQLFACEYVRINTSLDMKGIEFSVVLKNIYALAGGIFRGAGYGDNLLALFNANSINEMIHFLNIVVPNGQREFCSASYLGDFLVTAYSQYSRNRSFGMMIGRGYSVKSAQLELKMISEGYYASKCIHEIKKNYSINTPIADEVYNILYEHAPIKASLSNLLKIMK